MSYSRRRVSVHPALDGDIEFQTTALSLLACMGRLACSAATDKSCERESGTGRGRTGEQQASTSRRVGDGTLVHPSTTAAEAATAAVWPRRLSSITGPSSFTPAAAATRVVNHARFKLKHPRARRPCRPAQRLNGRTSLAQHCSMLQAGPLHSVSR